MDAWGRIVACRIRRAERIDAKIGRSGGAGFFVFYFQRLGISFALCGWVGLVCCVIRVVWRCCCRGRWLRWWVCLSPAPAPGKTFAWNVVWIGCGVGDADFWCRDIAFVVGGASRHDIPGDV